MGSTLTWLFIHLVHLPDSKCLGRPMGCLINRSVRVVLAACVVACLAVTPRACAEAQETRLGHRTDSGSAPSNRVNTAVVPLPGGGDTWKTRHEAINARAKQGHVDLIYIGDSIVRSWMWDGTPVWEHYYAKRQGMIAGMTGDRTEQVLWRLQNGNIDGISPKLAIVMIGQNNGPSNTGEEIAAGVTAIVHTLRQKLPTTKVLVLAIFPRGEKPTPERAVLAKANSIVSQLADGKYVFYLDVNHLFLRPDGSIPAFLMPDFEHPNEQGHRVWAAAIEPKVAELMGDRPTPPMPPKPSVQPL